MKPTKPTATPEVRVQQFFKYCNELEAHPFFLAHGTIAGHFHLDANCPEEGPDSASVNFDEIHLESILVRLRQFLFEGEFLFYKDVRRGAVELFGETAEFRSFYDKVVGGAKAPYEPTNVEAFKANGRSLTIGRTFSELLAARLYTGPLHSERAAFPRAGSAEEGLPGSHVSVHKHLSLELAFGAMACVQNIFSLRRNIYDLAAAAGKTELFAELSAYGKRVIEDGAKAPVPTVTP